MSDDGSFPQKYQRASGWTPPDHDGADAYSAAPPRQVPPFANDGYPTYGNPRVLPTSGYATAALVLGLGTFIAGGLAGLLAVIFGHIALREVNAGVRGGKGQAVAGLVLGYIAIVLTALLILLFVAGVIGAANTGTHA